MKKKPIKTGPKFPLLGYRPDIDGLRAVAVLSVVGFHAFPGQIRGGFAGVDVFFVISGLLISNQILHRLERGDFTLSGFYSRRIRRIFPALIVVLAACFAFGWFALFANEYAQLGKHIAAGATFLSNIVLWQESGYFDTSSRLKPLLHLWSLGVEEQFYLMWPLTLLLAFRLRLNVLRLVVVVLLTSFALNLYYLGRDASGAFYFPFTRFWELMAGGVLACIAGASRRFNNWASAAGIVLVLAGFAVLRESMAYPGAWALLPTLGAVLVLSAGPDAWVNRNILANRALVSIGLISYPLYLWHWSLLSFGSIVESGDLSTGVRWIAILLSVVLAFLTYRLIERPIRFGARTPAAITVAVVILIIIGGLGFTTFKADGAESRAANKGANFANDAVAPDRTFTSDGSCSALGLEQIKNEVCLAVDTHPDVLVIGDSHAVALNFAAYTKKIPLKTLLIAANSCLPFVDYVSRSTSERKEDKICTDVAYQILGAARSHPEMKNVVISTRGPIYFSGHAFGDEDKDPSRVNWLIEAVREPDPLTTNQERFLRGFSGFISTLEGYGRNVTFVIDVPELSADPHTCIPERPFTFSPRKASPCTVSRSVVDERQREYRAIVKSLAAEHPKLRIFDPLPIFCDQMLCYGKDDEHLFYYDSNHLSVRGSERLWSSLLPLLK